MGRYKKRGVLHFGIDYFKCVIEWNQESSLKTLSSNSSMLYIDNETMINYMSGMTSDYLRYYVIQDIKTNVNLAFIGIGGKESRRDFFEVTGQGLILRGGVEFYLNLRKILGFEIHYFTRIDVCLDLPNVGVKYLYDKIIEKKYKINISKIHYSKNGDEETIYFGEKSRKKNNYQLIRIYNKLLDSKKKKKEWLYPDYKDFTDVTRLEVEIREEKAKFWTCDKLQDVNFIFSVIVKQFYKFNYQFFGFLKFDDFLNYKKLSKSLHYERLEKINKRYDSFVKFGQDFFNEKEKKQRCSVFVAYGKRLIGNGYRYEELIDMIKISLQDKT